MLSTLLAGGDVAATSTTRAQLPLLLAQAPSLTTATIGQATETDTAQQIHASLATRFIIQVGQASEADTALPITFLSGTNQSVSVGQAVEADTALSIAAVATGNIFIAVGQASETDTAFSVRYRQSFMSVVGRQPLALTPVTDTTDPNLTPVVVV